MSLRYSFFAIVPDGIIEIPQGSNLSWLTLFYALPRELVEKYPPTLSLPRNIYELLDDPASMEVIKNDMFLFYDQRIYHRIRTHRPLRLL